MNSGRFSGRSKSTLQYIEKCEHVLSLRRQRNSWGGVKRFSPGSLSWLLLLKIKAIFSVWHYIYEIAIGWRWLVLMLRLKGTGRGKQAMVVGNGPSQGFLTEIDFHRFQKKGGEIYVVNFWNENLSFSTVVPDYIVFSDPVTLNFEPQYESFRGRNKVLKDYLESHPRIKIICPVVMCNRMAEMFGSSRVVGFIDTEIKGWFDFISPLLPRSYISMTLYKALAASIWRGYDRIFVIGMDNTYPRDIFSDKNNSILNYETHAGVEDFVADNTACYRGVGDVIFEIAHLFWDAKKFSRCANVVNLDPYSLTDAFEKSPIAGDYDRYW